jgi:hypothetical protein
MGVFEQYPLLAAFVIGVLVVLVVSAMRSKRAGSGPPGTPECPQCGARPPAHAKFCSRCGHDLSRPRQPM